MSTWFNSNLSKVGLQIVSYGIIQGDNVLIIFVVFSLFPLYNNDMCVAYAN